MAVPVGSKAPKFSLLGVDGETYSLCGFSDKKAVVVVFSCNHCPFVVMYEDRMIELYRDYAPRGVAMVAINPNDTDAYPADSYDNMKLRAETKGFEFAYVIDETQATARAYGATKTPEVFVVDADGTVVYHGRIDDNAEDASAVERQELREALDQLLAGQPIATPETTPIGCGIKWRPEAGAGCGSAKPCCQKECESEK